MLCGKRQFLQFMIYKEGVVIFEQFLHGSLILDVKNGIRLGSFWYRLKEWVRALEISKNTQEFLRLNHNKILFMPVKLNDLRNTKFKTI